MNNKIKNLLGPPQFYIVTYLLTDRATTRGPGGPKKRGFEGYRVNKGSMCGKLVSDGAGYLL